MSERSTRNRNLLLWRIALLALGYALPLGGLAIFFLLSGVRERITWVERERLGVQYIRQLATVHNVAVQKIWAPLADRSSPDVDQALEKLAELERALTPQLAARNLSGQGDTDLTAAQLRTAWEQAELDSDDRPERIAEIILFLGQLQAHLAHAADATGLTSSPDLETEYVIDVVAATLPVHVERLLQMHEQLIRLAPQERSMSEHLSTVFLRQLEKELPRLERGLRLAIESDLHSAHVSAEFHRIFPAAAGQFRQSLLRLTEELRADGNSAGHWDEVFGRAYGDAAQFWSLAIAQLDVLLADQIAHAERERNTAIVIAALILITLLPLTWLYYRRYVRPLVQDLVSEVREASDAALRAQNQFLAMMSHEIRTPMNGVIGFANLLADTKLDEQQREFVRTINASGESLLTIINDILDYSKLEADRIELEKNPIVVRDLLEDVLGLLSPAANAKQLELIAWAEPDVPEVWLGDPTRLQQILLNLAGNAVKFTATGHVELVVARGPEPGRLRFHVRDTGIGIPADRLDRLFKPFSQVDSSITRTHGGTGLGLAISQRLVTAMGGSIGVVSEPGRGTEFYFTLPIGAASGPTAPALADSNQVLSGCRVLVVDDSEASRRLFQRLLERHGAQVTAVDSAAAARHELSTHKFDLGILDYMMPGTDGLALARDIASHFAARHLILASSAAISSAAGELFGAVVLKPIRSRSFLQIVGRVLRGETSGPASTPAAVKAPPFAREHPLRILAVDDNPVNLKVISALLTALGYAPAVTDSAVKAMERLRTEPVDLVLMDVQMPEIDGHEATRRLRRGEIGELNRHTPVIALTAGATREEREACLAAGMDDFLAKPITRSALLEKLAAVVRQRTAE